IFDAEGGNFTPHVVDLAFALKFRRVHADDRKSFIAIARIPTLYRRQGIATVVATKRPEIDNDDATEQTLQRQRVRIDPGASENLRGSRRFCFISRIVWNNHVVLPTTGESRHTDAQNTQRAPALSVSSNDNRNANYNQQYCGNNVLSVHRLSSPCVEQFAFLP